MDDIGSFLFGDTEDAKQVGNASLLTPGQSDLLEQLTGLLQGQVGQGINAYPGELVPGPNQNLQSVFDMVQGITSGEDRMGLDTLLGDFDVEGTTDFFNTNVKDPAIEMWQQEILPVIKENYIAQNAGSSSAARGAITKSGEDLATELSRTLSNMLYTGKTAHEQNLPNVLQSILGMGSTAGAQEYGIDQAGLTADFEKWLSSQGYSNPWLNLLGTALNTRAIDPITQGPTTTEGALPMLADVAKLFF